MEAGALLNTLMLVGDARGLLRVYEEALPGLLRPLLHLARGNVDERALKGFYESLPVSDFSRDVLERASHRLAVLPVPACGWSDLGTPARIATFLSRHAPRAGPSTRPSAAGVGRRKRSREARMGPGPATSL